MSRYRTFIALSIATLLTSVSGGPQGEGSVRRFLKDFVPAAAGILIATDRK